MLRRCGPPIHRPWQQRPGKVRSRLLHRALTGEGTASTVLAYAEPARVMVIVAIVERPRELRYIINSIRDG